MTYSPAESNDQYHPLYNTVSQWLDGEATPPTMTNAPKVRQSDNNRAARNQAGRQRPHKSKSAAVPAE